MESRTEGLTSRVFFDLRNAKTGEGVAASSKGRPVTGSRVRLPRGTRVTRPAVIARLMISADVRSVRLALHAYGCVEVAVVKVVRGEAFRHVG
jgi:hypothetical protein